jgi:hypothetical protein
MILSSLSFLLFDVSVIEGSDKMTRGRVNENQLKFLEWI